MSLAFIIVLAVIGAGLIAVKIYFQEKRGQEEVAELQLIKSEEKPNEQIVAERLAEIAKSEEKVLVETKEVNVNPVVTTEAKPKAKPHSKKKGHSTKKQPKIKAK